MSSSQPPTEEQVEAIRSSIRIAAEAYDKDSPLGEYLALLAEGLAVHQAPVPTPNGDREVWMLATPWQEVSDD